VILFFWFLVFWGSGGGERSDGGEAPPFSSPAKPVKIFPKRLFCRSGRGARMGKPYRHLRHEITPFTNLLRAFCKAARGKC
jgi:hypothetical protein